MFDEEKEKKMFSQSNRFRQERDVRLVPRQNLEFYDAIDVLEGRMDWLREICLSSFVTCSFVIGLVLAFAFAQRIFATFHFVIEESTEFVEEQIVRILKEKKRPRSDVQSSPSFLRVHFGFDRHRSRWRM